MVLVEKKLRKAKGAWSTGWESFSFDYLQMYTENRSFYIGHSCNDHISFNEFTRRSHSPLHPQLPFQLEKVDKVLVKEERVCPKPFQTGLLYYLFRLQSLGK